MILYEYGGQKAITVSCDVCLHIPIVFSTDYKKGAAAMMQQFAD